MRRTVSDNAVEFARRWETFKPVPYYATAKEKERGILTWGYGHTGTRAQAPASITEPDALALLRQDMAEAERQVDAVAHPLVTGPYFDAMVDLVFNAGPKVIGADTGTGQALRRGDIATLRTKLPQFIYQGGKVMLGLRRRATGRLALFDGKSAAEAEAIGRAVK
ncbi:endolysin [Klebsiella phage VLCpiS11a]|uniref:endolysin n=1 Tax=Klebsiella phage VLCpiS11a TaxID=2874884 RepID=UPI0022DCDB9C|nr:endolysin [Klebsiella phage VLCpiS11a]UVX30661.1 endolysin [Klebsiella phage VLCpiS11a]